MEPAVMAADRQASHAPLRVLLVDDDESDRLAICRCLRKSGIPVAVDEVASAAETLQRIPGAGYDCVVLDYFIPDANGLSLLQGIRRLEIDMPVVMFTGRGDEEIAVELMKAGAVDYLPKASLTPERLASSLRHAMQLSRAAAERRRAFEELRAEEQRFRTLANAIPQLAWISDGEGRRFWYNDRWYEFSGSSFEQSRDLGWQQLHHPDHLDRVRRSQSEAFARGALWEETFPLRRRDGAWRWFLVRAVPIPGIGEGPPRWLGTNTDITEQKQAEEERERLLAREQEARAAAERAIKARDEVLGIVAHDLRNPVHTVTMSATVLLEPSLSDERRLRQAAIVQRCAGGMERLIQDLLDVSLLESGNFAIRGEPVQLPGVLDEAVDLFDMEARSRRISFSCEVSPEMPPVRGDRRRLLQVLSNLLGNAFRFTPAGGRVALGARREGAVVEVRVEDSGPGIPPENLSHVFDRFWQADRTAGVGAGLGLAISKGIIEAHGGRIWVESAVGRGTTVYFTVPAVLG